MSRTTSPTALPETVGELHAGESLGHTTALLPDSVWQYSAEALEDTWILTVSGRDLSDLLRGRGELAHAVLRGFYDTFRRRLTQIVEQGRSVKREWILAVDVDKSPMIRGAEAHFRHLAANRMNVRVGDRGPGRVSPQQQQRTRPRIPPRPRSRP